MPGGPAKRATVKLSHPSQRSLEEAGTTGPSRILPALDGGLDIGNSTSSNAGTDGEARVPFHQGCDVAVAGAAEQIALH